MCVCVPHVLSRQPKPKPKAKAVIVSSTDPAPVSPLRSCMPPWSIPEHGIAPDRILCGSFGDIGCIQDGNLVDSNGSSVGAWSGLCQSSW